MNQLFALSLGIAAMVFAASQSNAQTAGPACAARVEVVQALASKYGETRQAMGLAATTQLMEIYASPTGSWSLTVTLADGTTCLVASGQNFDILSEPLALNDPPA